MSNSGLETIQIVILGIVAVAVLLQAGLVLALLIGMGKMSKTIKEEIADIRSSVMPMVHDTREFVSNITPKVEATVDDLSAVIHNFRSQSHAINEAGNEMVERFRHQSARIDSLMTGLLDTTERTSNIVADKVGRPVRQLAGMVASAKAVVDTLRGGSVRAQRAARERDQRDMFV